MKLAEWFKITLRNKADFAARIDVTPQMISAYCDGRTIPNKERIEAIYRETGHQVAPNDWYDLREDVA